MNSQLGTAGFPIDVDIYSIFDPSSKDDYVEQETISLKKETVSQTDAAREYTLFDSNGDPLKFRPRFHVSLINCLTKNFTISLLFSTKNSVNVLTRS